MIIADMLEKLFYIEVGAKTPFSDGKSGQSGPRISEGGGFRLANEI
jgi:hypothetical protein